MILVKCQGHFSLQYLHVQLVSIDTDFIRDCERNLRSSLLPGKESNGFLTRVVSRSRLTAGKTMLPLLSKKDRVKIVQLGASQR